jgi:hypothetical protein
MITLLYTNASTVHSASLYTHASCNYNKAAKASTNNKWSAVLCDEAEMGEFLCLSESKGSLSYSVFDTDN